MSSFKRYCLTSVCQTQSHHGCFVTYRDLFFSCRARVDVACAGRIWPAGCVFDMPALLEQGDKGGQKVITSSSNFQFSVSFLIEFPCGKLAVRIRNSPSVLFPSHKRGGNKGLLKWLGNFYGTLKTDQVIVAAAWKH